MLKINLQGHENKSENRCQKEKKKKKKTRTSHKVKTIEI